MVILDTVAGLELFAVQGKYGVYLKCDKCGATLDAKRENVGRQDERISADEGELVARAKALGWTGPLTRRQELDCCPACSKKP